MKSQELDKMFDDNKNMIEHLDLSKIRKPQLEQKRVNIDFPTWMIQSLDKQSKKFGVTRQSIIKLWIAERLKEEQSQAKY